MVFNLRNEWDSLAAGQREVVSALMPKAPESSIRAQWNNAKLPERAFVMGVGQIVSALKLTSSDFGQAPEKPKTNYFR